MCERYFFKERPANFPRHSTKGASIRLAQHSAWMRSLASDNKANSLSCPHVSVNPQLDYSGSLVCSTTQPRKAKRRQMLTCTSKQLLPFGFARQSCSILWMSYPTRAARSIPVMAGVRIPIYIHQSAYMDSRHIPEARDMHPMHPICTVCPALTEHQIHVSCLVRFCVKSYNYHPNKHETFIQCWNSGGPAS